MNNYFSIIIISLLLLVTCSDEKVQLISNPPDYLSEQNYKLNLKSVNSGTNLETVTINWNETGNEVTLINLSSNETINQSGNSYTYTNLLSGNFLDIEVSGNKNDSIYTDTIQIFTRSVYPVTNFEFEIEEVMRGNEVYDEGESYTDIDENGEWNEGENFVDGIKKKYHRKLRWALTKEPENSFQQYNIFRSGNAEELIYPENCNCKIDNLSSLLDSTYIDSSFDIIDEAGIAAFYYMVQVSTGDFTKNSFIFNSNFTQPGQIQLNEENVSTNKNDYIDITWKPISNSNYFYQYEIYRAPDKGLTDITLMAQIPNSSVKHFQDRKAGNGTTWYYSVAVVDVNGRKHYSDYVSGWSMP